jgi:hypothetical protein
MFRNVEQKKLMLTQLNQIKKDNPEQRKLQNKRYREKNRVILLLKKQLDYQQKKYISKLNSN